MQPCQVDMALRSLLSMRGAGASAGSSEELHGGGSAMFIRAPWHFQIEISYYQEYKLIGCKGSIVRAAAIGENFLQKVQMRAVALMPPFKMDCRHQAGARHHLIECTRRRVPGLVKQLTRCLMQLQTNGFLLHVLKRWRRYRIQPVFDNSLKQGWLPSKVGIKSRFGYPGPFRNHKHIGAVVSDFGKHVAGSMDNFVPLFLAVARPPGEM